ncbi:unnamed protein product [Hymenolepis diminuta]|uniref:PAN2-PAN3 deadenylation complex catalytic subunit PAN2 N-terminal domain-containing protein n=2 Tax=Hymenolepis diminuta TaxID=6216 RepID=A0A564Y8W0_HYMDI|nr:unnamed protein product [Hymenolepis diminuta]
MENPDVVQEEVQFYNTGGHWLMATQSANPPFAVNRIVDVAFDPLEELVWCISENGQFSSFYGSTLELYTTNKVTPMKVPGQDEQVCELKSIFPSSRYSERHVYILASNAIYVYSKFGRGWGFATAPGMTSMVCMTAAQNSPAPQGNSDFDRFFCGGMQSEVFELDANPGSAFGATIRTYDVGEYGAVTIKPFTYGICVGNICGQVKMIDPRSRVGVFRTFEAHSGEISDMAVLNDGTSLVTTGWSRQPNGSLRIDRLVYLFDLRFVRLEAPLTTVVDPCYVSTVGSTQRLIVASQPGAFQTLELDGPNVDPQSLGNIMVENYDQVNAFRVSSNGESLIFGTECGNLHLYSSSLEACRFNHNSIPTEFASNLADGLRVADLNANAEEDFDLPISGSYALAKAAGRKMLKIAEAAANEAIARETGSYCLFKRPGAGAEAAMSLPYLERLRLTAYNSALNKAFNPIDDFDGNTDSIFAFSAVPFKLNPPTCAQAELSEWVCSSTGSIRDGYTSDWPADLCGVINRGYHSIC